MNTAILVIDLQRCNYHKKFDSVVEQVKKLLRWGRKKRFKIIYACDSRYEEDKIFQRLSIKKHCIRGTKDTQVLDEIKPAKDDVVIEKRMLSAFFSTDLDFTLRQLDVDRLIITGIAAEACVLKTALDAFELGYDMVVPEDCIGSVSEERYRSAITILKFLKIKTIKLEEMINEIAS